MNGIVPVGERRRAIGAIRALRWRMWGRRVQGALQGNRI